MTKDFSFGIVPIRFQPKREYLILRHQAGHWDFPKGHPENSESPRETAARELKEETGLEIKEWLNQPTQTIKYIGEKDGVKVAKTVQYFPAIVEGEIVLEKGKDTEAVWLPFQKALKRLTYKNSQQILEQIDSYSQQTN